MDSWNFLIFLITIYVSCSKSQQNPCSTVVELDGKAREVSRRLTGQDVGICDHQLAEGWYRFKLANRPAQIPTQCIRNKLCGTEIPYWLDLGEGQLPAAGNESTGSFCASYDVLGVVDCCVLRIPARIYNCGNEDYVYFLNPTDRCPVSFCVQDTGKALDPAYTTARGNNASELQELSPVSTNGTGEVLDQQNDQNSTTVGSSTSAADVTSSPSTNDSQPTNAPPVSLGPANLEQGTTGAIDSTGTTVLGSVSPKDKSLSNDTESGQTSADSQGSSPFPNTTEPVEDALNLTVTSPAPVIPDQPQGTAGLSVSGAGTTIPDGTEAPASSRESTADVYPAPSETPGKTTFISENPAYSSTNPQSSDGTEVPTDSTKVTFISNVPIAEPTPVRPSQGQSSQAASSDQPPVPVSDPDTTPLAPSQPVLTMGMSASSSSVGATNQPVPDTPDVTTEAPIPLTDAPETSESVTTEVKSSSTESPAPVTSDPHHDSTVQVLTTAKPEPETSGVRMKIKGEKITSEGVRQALITAILRRCSIGLDTAPPAVRQVFVKYRLCERTGRRKRQSRDEGGLNPVVTGAYQGQSGIFEANVSLAKSDGTTDTFLPAQDLLTILEDEEIKSTFLTELGVEDAEVCSQKEGCSVLSLSNKSAPRHSHDEESGVFQSYLGLFIAMIVIGSLCLIIIIFALLYIRCRSRRGSWRTDYHSPERTRLNGKGKKHGAMENPAVTDEEMMKDEGEMREKDNPQTSVNGLGNYPDEDNGWVVPFDELTPEERALPGLSDTKL